MCRLIKILRYQLVFLFFLITTSCWSQVDSVMNPKPIDTVLKTAPPVQYKSKVDSVMAVHSPKKAAIRSALLPGWGQIYNKKYWKLPIVYGALGTTGTIFFYNLSNYKDLRFAYKAKYKAEVANPRDSSDLGKIRPDIAKLDLESIRLYRNEFRQNIDYSVLFFLLFWGLNVVDATVDAHLKAFDVSPDLSLKLKPTFNSLNRTTGLSLVLAFK